jgi:hypothetical protein
LFFSITLFCAVVLSACSSTLPLDARIWLDSSNHSETVPAWSRGPNEVWESNGKVFVRASETVSGDERVDTCFESAQTGSHGEVLVALARELRATLATAALQLNENAESLLAKVGSGEFSGRVPGLRHTEKYFERYRISEMERIDCHVLGEMTRQDFDRSKRAILDRLQKVDSRLREIVARGQVRFFERGIK